MPEQIVKINERRMYWVLSIFACVHAVHVVLFWPATPAQRWRLEVTGVHSAMFILIAMLGAMWLVRSLTARGGRPVRALPQWLPEAVGFAYLLAGAALAVADQREAPSITALMTTSIGVGLTVLTRPFVAVVQYMVTLGLFLVGVAQIQTEPSVLLSVRVNSISAIGLGLALSLLQWHNGMRALQQQRRVAEQQAELEAKNRELTVMATTDSLTGLVNRLEFSRVAASTIAEQAAAQESDAADAAHGLPACLIMADIDNFKDVNDEYGHLAGDEVLIAVATVMRNMLRASDIVGRFGGEEFIILLPGHTVEAGVRVAERLRTAIQQQPIDLGGQKINVTLSFGVAGIEPGGNPDGDRSAAAGGNGVLAQALIAADRALYAAKHAGRNCIRYEVVTG